MKVRTVAIETSTEVGSVACVANARPVSERVFKEGLAHGRDLVVELDACIEAAGWAKADIELIAVSVGPGSYTGVRVGVAAAKALSYALSAPVSPVCSLDVVAENGPRTADHLAIILDARRNQIYGAFYVNVGFSFFREEGPIVTSPEEFAARLPKPCFLLGEGLWKYAEAFRRPGFEPVEEAYWRPSATNTGLLGEKAYLIGERADAAAVEPLYLRPLEAEEKWRRRQEEATEASGGAGEGGQRI